MKPVNQKEIKKQSILFSLSLLGLVVAVALFTSAFFWSSNSEIEWSSDLRKEHATLGVQIDSLKIYLIEIQNAITKYESVKAGDMSEQTLKNNVDKKIGKLKSVSTEQAGLNEIAEKMDIMLTSYLNRQKDLKACQSNEKSIENRLRDKEDELDKCEKKLENCERINQSSNIY